MVNNKRNEYKCWALGCPMILAEVHPTPSNIKLCWNACHEIDLFLLKLTGSTPPYRRNKHG
jgi:hypothetical protein